MMYLFGQVDVIVLRVEAESRPEAIKEVRKLARKPAAHLTKLEKEERKLHFHFEWQEYPETDVVAARYQLLQAFLQLVQNLPASKEAIEKARSRIIDIKGNPILIPPTPPPGSIVVTDETKIEDHEGPARAN